MAKGVEAPWNLLAYSQAGVPQAVQPAACAGAHGVSFILASASAALTARAS